MVEKKVVTLQNFPIGQKVVVELCRGIAFNIIGYPPEEQERGFI